MNKVINTIEDLCSITTIPTASMSKIFDKLSWCVCNAMHESILENNSFVEVNIGLGNLIISIEDNTLQYKFIPNVKLEHGLVETIVNKKNPLECNIENTFVKRITNTYKDMF